MTEKEILAELKTAYWFLQDIDENHEEQITINEEKYVRLSMQNLEILYSNLYKRIEKENKEILLYEKDVMIADTIYNDYIAISEDYDEQYICYDDTEKKTKWWEDYDYLLK